MNSSKVQSSSMDTGHVNTQHYDTVYGASVGGK